MNLEEFNEKYKDKKDIELIDFKCDYVNHEGDPICRLKKVSIRRNMKKNKNNEFICVNCHRQYKQENNLPDANRHKKEILEVLCSICKQIRNLKKSGYHGDLSQKPYIQTCRSCIQIGKVISKEQREKISKKLTGRKITEEERKNRSEYLKKHLDDVRLKNLMRGNNGCTKGKPLSEEHKRKISESNKGRIFSPERNQKISDSRKEMFRKRIEETGSAYSMEIREKISSGVVKYSKEHPETNRRYLSGLHYSDKLNNFIYHASALEKKAYMLLDEDPLVLYYDRELTYVNYMNPIKNCICKYIIDIDVMLLDGTIKYIEVKPKEQELNPVNISKFSAGTLMAKKEGRIYEIWDEISLFGEVETYKKYKNFKEQLSLQIDFSLTLREINYD